MMCDMAKGARRVWDLRNTLYADRAKYPSSAIRLTFTSNHDENSWNGSEFKRFGAGAGRDDGTDVPVGGFHASDLYGAGDRLRPFVRLL